MDQILYLLDESEKEEMKGIIRVKEKCPVCRVPFEEVKKLGFSCPVCNRLPHRFYIDLRYQSKRIRIFSDNQGQPIDSYQRAKILLSVVNHEIKNHSFDPSKYLRSELEKFWASNLLDKFCAHKLKSIAPSYQKDYERMVKLAKDYFKDKDVREIKKIDLVDYAEYVKENFSLSPKSIKNITDLFKTFMNYLKDELEVINAVPGFPKIEVEEFLYKWLLPEDQIKLFELVPDEHKPIIAFLMLHGCRPSEARALKCKDVNLAHKSITISATFSNGIYREKRKGKQSRAVTIPIHPEMYDFVCERVKGNLPEAYLFVNSKTGDYYRETYLKRVWHEVRKKAGIAPSLRLYDATRHSVASQLVNSNVSLYKVSKLLGHSSMKTTEKYAHANIEGLRTDIEKLSLKSGATVTGLSPEGKRSI